MDNAAVRSRIQDIVREHGPWTAHNIHLGDGLYTIDARVVGDEISLRRMLQLVSDLAQRPLAGLRILDLACLEGMYGLELARHGARVVGIEGREQSLVKARLAKEALRLEDVELHVDDVRNLSEAKYGRFDVVLCIGLLYHLNVPDIFTFLESIAGVCDGFAIVHTHVSTEPKVQTTHRGKVYAGRRWMEHLPEASADERKRALWASLDDTYSFMLTRPSLFNALEDAGFTSVYEVRMPHEPRPAMDVCTLVAIKGRRQQVLNSPLVNDLANDRWDEKAKYRVHTAQKWWYPIARRYFTWLPRPVMDLAKKMLGLWWAKAR